MKVYADIIQGTPEWDALRLGKVTASCFSDVLNKKTGRGTYMLKLAAERMTGEKQETYKNGNMERGSDCESLAREYYELRYDCPVDQVGFIERDDWVGISPDGLVGDEGIIEIKCPNTTTHLTYILENRLPPCYVPQVQGQLWISGRQWCDFISYDPRMTRKSFLCVPVLRDEKYIEELAAEVDRFVDELKQLLNQFGD